MIDRLDKYRLKRDARRTPEPIPRSRPKPSGGGRFVIQQHHARSLHWDVRLEREGVLVSFAVPRGLPRDKGRNHLARHTEDHPLEYLDFTGEIPAGEYGSGRMIIHDHGTYECYKWRDDDEIGVTFHGERTSGRYVFFRTDARDWMVRRMDPPAPGWETMPEAVEPMLATRAAGLPTDDQDWGYEMSWGGVRAQAFVYGGRLRLMTADGDVTHWYPELRPLSESLAPVETVLDGEIVAFDGPVPSADLLRRRESPKDTAAAKRAAERTPVQFLAYDLLWLEGHSTLELVRYAERREILEGLDVTGASWQTPPFFAGGGAYALEAARAQGLDGIVAKRLDSPYLPGRRSRLWSSIPC